MRRLLARHLDDVLSQVRLHRGDARVEEGLVQLDLLGGHGLRLHGQARARPAPDVEHDGARLLGRGGEVDVSTPRLDVVDELSEIVVQALEGGLLDLARPVAQGLPFRELAERFAAQPDELGGGDGEGLLQEAVLQRSSRPFPEGRVEVEPLLHRDSPASSSARCMARGPAPRRLRPPPICMRQPASQATTQSACVSATFPSFLSRMAVDTSGRRTENEPPKPQHSSAPASSTNSAPSRLRRMARGAADSCRPRSRWQESWYVTRPRTVLTKRVLPRTCTRNCDSSWVRPASPSASRRRAGSVMRPAYSCFTIQAHEPEGTTTCWELRKRVIVRAATAAAPRW